jgi:acetoin utilization deacetylase AcuC-like enzyme/GNAT superfamily N-acetyltransferase
MLRIRRIYDDIVPINKDRLKKVQEILLKRFNEVSKDEIALIGEKLRNPFKQRFKPILLVAESLRGKVHGFAMLLHEPEIGFAYLDWIATSSGRAGGGIGGAIYDRVRWEASALEVKGLFFECLPDDPDACPDPELLKNNRARFRFYERYGARPIINTSFEMPVKEGDTCMPHLVYDGLESQKPLSRVFVRKVVRAILERKYAKYCPADYVDKVVASFKDDPVRLREFRYVKPEAVVTEVASRSADQISLIVNEHHEIHHVHERGYVESPVRVRSILTELEKSGMFARITPRTFPDTHINAVHEPAFINYLRKACSEVPEGESIYPYIFPIRNKTRPPKEPSVLSGYYCIDTFTPINKNVYPAARGAVNSALTAAKEILDGRRIAYALVRPPGHHAERRVFGGFCYFNNNAIAAHYLSAYGKVAILDMDYHHGNGQQDIFYRRSDVLTVSIHGHPSFAYPYFCGFEDEKGEDDGEGFNLNLPLTEKVNGEQYRKALSKAIRRIEEFKPQFLVVALGLDPAKGDPTGTWLLIQKDFEENGRMIGAMGLPTVIVQEGGYRTQSLGRNAMAFFRGIVSGSQKWTGNRPVPLERLQGVTFRFEVVADDADRIRRLVEITGFFYPAEVDIAEELVKDRISNGSESGYFFIVAEHYGRLVGYACYGPIPCTVASYDLYWIAVHPDFQGRGLGRDLMNESEKRIAIAGGRRIYVDTSERPQYDSTRAFYEKNGYRLEAVFKDFYAPGDGKAVYCKTVA